jgi:hypothetical protein
MRQDFSKLLFWAKKAAMIDLETDPGQEDFYRLAKESGLGEKQLTYYANAYEAAGESGLRALSYKKRMPEGIRKEVMEKINNYLSSRVPPHLCTEIGFLVKSQGNTIIASDKRISFSNKTKTICIEIFQVRYTDFDNRWHLYWMRKFGKWWPYVTKKPIFTIEDCIRELNEDAWGCFWG